MNASDTANTKQKKLANSANPQMVALIQSLAGTISTSSSGTEVKGRISHKKLNESVATALHSALFVNSIDPLPTIPLFTPQLPNRES